MLIRCDDAAPALPPCGCCLPGAARGGVGRRGVLRAALGGAVAGSVLRGRQARAQEAAWRIDVHHHYTSPALLAMMRGRRTNQTFNMGWTVEKSLEAMDAAGVATAVVSTSDPGVFFGDYDAARGLARDCNEYQARMVADHRGRFGMFTTLPLPDVDNTLAEIAYGMDTLRAQGVGMMTSYGTKYLGDPAFTPVMEELQRRRATVFVHPLQPACCSNVVPGVPDVVVEYATETSRTVASLLMSGTTVRFPDIKWIFSHGGGAVPYLTFRFNRMVGGNPELMRSSPDGAVGLIRRLYFDTAQAWNGYTLPSLLALMPVEHVVFGSDFPAASPLDTARGLDAAGLPAEALRRIGRENARGMMPGLG